MKIMWKRKIIVSAALLAVLTGLAIFFSMHSGEELLSWKMSSLQPVGHCWVRDHWEQNCWGVELEVSNHSLYEVTVDWHRDRTAFKIGGQWQSLDIQGLVIQLAPHESKRFSLYVPQRAQACRMVIYYWHGARRGRIWSAPSSVPSLVNRMLFTFNSFAAYLDARLPGHYKRLVMQVEIPAAGEGR